MSRVNKIATIRSQLRAFSTYAYLFQQQVADKMNLHPTDFHSVHLLDTHGEMTAGSLATRLNLTTGATTAVIDRLVALGYAERAASDTDRRSTIIRIRPASIKRMKVNYSSLDEKIQDKLGQFSDVELDVIERFMRALTEL